MGTAYDALRSQKPVTSAGGIPPPLVEWRIVEQIADSVPVIPMLFMVEPQMVEQLVDKLSPLDFRVAEQVIEVPKIVCPPRAARTVLCAPQTAEQLVEVLTPVSISSSVQRSMEQIVYIPASVRGVSGSLLGFPPEQGTTAPHVSPERISVREEELTRASSFDLPPLPRE